MSKFFVWIDNPTSQIETVTSFGSNDERIRGFMPNEKIKSKIMNTALRQANLISVALMEALGVSDNINVASSVSAVKTEILTKLNEISAGLLNIRNGDGAWSLVQKRNPASSQNKAYQSGSIAFGGNTQAGMTETEYYDKFGPNGEGGILYPNSFSFAAAFGDSCKSYGRSTFTAGQGNKAYSRNGIAIGQNNTNYAATSWVSGISSILYENAECSFSHGSGLQTYGSHCFNVGEQNILEGIRSVIGGWGCHATKNQTITFGQNLKNTLRDGKTVLGVFNDEQDGEMIDEIFDPIIFEFGGGYDDRDRKTLMKIYQATGRMSILGAPRNETDVVRLKELNAVKDKIPTVFKPVGARLVSWLSQKTLDANDPGVIASINGDFITSDLFLEGAGKSYAAGSDVMIVLEGGVKKFDVLGSMISNVYLRVQGVELQPYTYGFRNSYNNNLYGLRHDNNTGDIFLFGNRGAANEYNVKVPASSGTIALVDNVYAKAPYIELSKYTYGIRNEHNNHLYGLTMQANTGYMYLFGKQGSQNEFKLQIPEKSGTIATLEDTPTKYGAPTGSDGTYVLKAVKSGSSITYSWVKES